MHKYSPALLVSLACLAAPLTAQAAVPAPIFDTAPAALAKGSPAASAFPDASAITLRDESVVTLNADGTSTDVTHQTFKIFNQRGHDKGEVSIPFNASNEKIVNLHARTIRADGTVLTAQAGDIHQSAPFSDFAMYDDAKVISVSMPGIEDGVIVDYVYTRKTTQAFLPGQFSSLWSFRDGVDPVAMSKMTLTAPSSVKIKTLPHNAASMTTSRTASADGKKITYIWKMAGLPPLVPEPMMPPANSLLPWVEISTVPSWQAISRWYQGLAAGQMAVSPEIKDTVKTLTAGKTTDTDKARAIYYWVEGRTRYVALELGQSAFQPHAAAAVCRNRYGDCKDMATLLVTMLHEAGIQTAWPVLLGADSQQPVDTYLAAPSFFNHAIVRADIDGKPYWLDSTAEMCPFGDIPGGDRGVDALVVRNGVGAFEKIPLGSPEDNSQATFTTVTLHADGSADCETSITLNGDAGLGARVSFRGLQTAQVRPGLQNMVSGFSPNATLTDYTLSDLNDRDQAVVFTLKYHAPLWATHTSHLLILTGKDMTAAPYDRTDRTFPIYESKTGAATDDTVITLPPGYALEDKPEDIHETTPIGNVLATVTVNGDTLTQHLAVTSHPGQIAPDAYTAAKTQHEKIVALRRQPIVLLRLDKTASL